MVSERMAGLSQALEARGVSTDGLTTSAEDSSTRFFQWTISFLGGIASSVVGIVFFLFLLILMLLESRNLPSKFRDVTGRPAIFVSQFQRFAREIQKQYLIQTFSNFLSATALTLLFFLFDVDFALLWGTLAFFLGYIPNVGLIIATLPAVIITLILHGLPAAVLLVILGIIINASMDNVVTPKFMGVGLQLPFVIVFSSFLLWSWVFGFVGALLAVPSTLLLRLLLESNGDTRFGARFLQSEVPEESPPPVDDTPPPVAEPVGATGSSSAAP
jgi:predicted PurR-regulated permease PerM